jgi:phenylacetate-coenzyme A ligase PaaK-like adenylate-forming protein
MPTPGEHALTQLVSKIQGASGDFWDLPMLYAGHATAHSVATLVSSGTTGEDGHHGETQYDVILTSCILYRTAHCSIVTSINFSYPLRGFCNNLLAFLSVGLNTHSQK